MKNTSVSIFSEHTSPRLYYICEVLFASIMKMSYSITHQSQVFQHSSGIKINYSTIPLECDLQISPISLLFESDIRSQSIKMDTWQSVPIFFCTQSFDIPFDLLAASFYLLSRYEEYLPYTPDEYGRFPHTASLAYQHQFLQIPLVDIWVSLLKEYLSKKNPAFALTQPCYQCIASYDIDMAYSYKGKGILRNLGAFLRDLKQFNTLAIRARIRTLLGLQQDPFDTFDKLDVLHANYPLSPIYFILLGRGSELDKNLPPDNAYMKELIRRLSSSTTVGIHPSWKSHESEEELLGEFAYMPDVKCSRQHYIKFTLPDTFRTLVRLGITDEYSMGYGSINGYRASTAYPYSWFDLKANQNTDLCLHSFCFMECNSYFEQHYSQEQAYAELCHYWQQTKRYGGEMIMIWHNFSLGTEPMWEGWYTMYERFLKECYTPCNKHENEYG